MRFCPRCGSRYDHERFCPEDGSATELLEAEAPAADGLIGTLIDARYRIDAKIGEGGMGVVYKATHVALNKALALKVLRGEMAREPEAVGRFMQEAQAATSIGHENIVDINDFGALPDGTAYFVMEYLGGRPLSELIKRGGSIPTGDAISILRQVASALGAAHERGIVHRDLKPDNVIVSVRGELQNFVKVLDFGIAKVGSAKNKLTRTGRVFGTPHYMSPEQAAGQSVDARTDIYALGVMMYEMFTGRVPFEGDTFMGVLNKHMFEKPAPMFGQGAERQLGALEQITMRALEKKPENRYASMEALIEDLDLVAGGGVPRSVPGQRPSTELADALEPRTHSELRIEQRMAESRLSLPAARRRWPYALAALLLAALATLGVALAIRRSPTNEAVARRSPPLLPLPGAELGAVDGGRALAGASGEEPAPRSRSITLRTEPTGAEVILAGAIVGRTPAELPRPQQGEREVELRLAGHQRELVRLHTDSPETLELVLRKRTPTSTPEPRATRPAPAKQPEGKRKRVSSEVVDPWDE